MDQPDLQSLQDAVRALQKETACADYAENAVKAMNRFHTSMSVKWWVLIGIVGVVVLGNLWLLARERREADSGAPDATACCCDFSSLRGGGYRPKAGNRK